MAAHPNDRGPRPARHDGVPNATVLLRGIRDSDEDVVYRTLTDLDVWENRSPRLPRPVSLEAFRTARADRAADESMAQFVIEAEGRPVGHCALSGIDPLARHAEVAISLVAEARGQGFGTQALRQLVEFGFERWNLHRLRLSVIGSNVAARAVYRKVGFVEEGRLREQVWVRGRWDDEIIMGLLRADWRATGV